MEFIERKQLKEKPAKGTQLGFGHYFTDYMFTMKYTAGGGLARREDRAERAQAL